MEEPRVPTTPPHSLEAEKSILGSMLLSHTAVEQAMETLSASDFYLARHQDIFQAIKGIYDRGEAIDSVTVIDALDRMGKLASVGGVMYITELSLYVPSAANAAHYIRIVEERSVMRQLIEASTAIASDAFSGEKSLEQMLDDAERAIFNISMKKTSDTLVHISETVLSCYNRVGELMKLNGALTGVTTGFADLDKLTSGMQPSDLIIIAGRPSMGKTAFALNLAQNAAVKGKKTVCIFSLEMSREQLVQRMLCSDSGVNMQSVRTGTITDAELIRIASSLDPLSKASIYIDDSAGCSVAEIRSKCRRLQSRVGLDMVVIDYLQLMQTSGKYDNRVLEISETTRKLKILARELNVPILLLSQLSRGPEQRTDHRPVMADLRESGAIEQDADVIMLLYRPAVYDAEADNTTEVIVAKHRNGPTATVKLAWIDSSAKFADLDTTAENHIPEWQLPFLQNSTHSGYYYFPLLFSFFSGKEREKKQKRKKSQQEINRIKRQGANIKRSGENRSFIVLIVVSFSLSFCCFFCSLFPEKRKKKQRQRQSSIYARACTAACCPAPTGAR